MAGLGSLAINAETPLSFKGQTYGTLKIQAGDCFVVTRPQPYVKSLEAWTAGGAGFSGSNFYTPFGPIATPTLDASAAPAAAITKISDFELKITVNAGITATADFKYKINSIKNPYSQIQNVDIDIKHYPACATTGVATPYYQGTKPNLGT
jgi:hypothetical protein